jgi:hypothetical protein
MTGHYAQDVSELESIGVGGFAEVLKAKWKGIDVAVKKLFLNRGNEEASRFVLFFSRGKKKTEKEETGIHSADF